ncbi:hypothetical protein HZ994_06155 [Akkermansiaceae bacterium]|nr:hypothetical protein HZ994_06155 [Akkermansiaceae bacterium]
MSLHFETSISAKRRVHWERVTAALLGMVAGLVFVVLGAVVMDGVKLRKVPDYRPQFVMFAGEEKTTCGGMISCPVQNPVRRKPVAPLSGVMPLGLSPHDPPDRLFLTFEEFESALPVVDSGDERW